MGTRVKHGMIALFGCAFGFGASVTLQEASSPSIASAPSPAGMVLRLTFPEAHAHGHGRKGTRKRSPAQRKFDEKRRREEDEKRRREEAKKNPVKRKVLRSGDDDTSNCVYDSYASTSGSSDIYNCGGNYYRRSKKDGVWTYEAVKP